MDLKTVTISPPEGYNIIIGMAHFIKTVEDLYEVMISSIQNAKFGLAFCEASGPCLIRHAGNDKELEDYASKKALEIGAGHSFFIAMKNMYPINVLNSIKMIQEVCTLYCATANPLEVLIVETKQGRAIIGVVDGEKPKRIEGPDEIVQRRNFLRNIGYKM
jgi:adenosine/AMP kinase